MDGGKNTKLYNLLLPLWILVLWPSWLWAILIPANYLIDRIVLRWSLGNREDKKLFCRKHTWEICLAGFFGDFVGALFLFALLLLGDRFVPSSLRTVFLEMRLAESNPFGSVPAFIAVALSVALAGAVIYLLDRLILKAAGLGAEEARRSALKIALITAPYLYFIPSSLLYR